MNKPDNASEPLPSKIYRLLAPDGSTYESTDPGTLGGYRKGRIYGRLDCWSARKFLARGGYTDQRVFFADERAAIAAGYRPCGHCLRDRYKVWKSGGQIGTSAYPWLIEPPTS